MVGSMVCRMVSPSGVENRVSWVERWQEHVTTEYTDLLQAKLTCTRYIYPLVGK